MDHDQRVWLFFRVKAFVTLPSPLPSVSSYFPVIFASVVRLCHFGTCAGKMMENQFIVFSKVCSFILKQLEPVIFLIWVIS